MKTQNFDNRALEIFVKRLSGLNNYLILMVIGLIISFNTSYSQIIPSSCTGPLSVVNAYKVDASQIAILKFFDQNSPYKDSIEVPDVHRDTILDALVAVYNIDSPERDSVIDMFDIHILYQNMGDVVAKVDTTFFTLNEPTLDSLMTKYNLVPFYGVISPSHIGFHVEDKYNQRALISELNKVHGISYTDWLYIQFDGPNIEAEIHDDHVELIYSYPWDLCPFACQYRRFWKFKVYYDCSVEFVESYGDVYPSSNVSILEEKGLENLEIYPNPTRGNVNFTLNYNSNIIDLEVFDIAGKKVKFETFTNQGNGEFNNSFDISALKNGIYFCKFTMGDIQVVRKIIKQ